MNKSKADKWMANKWNLNLQPYGSPNKNTSNIGKNNAALNIWVEKKRAWRPKNIGQNGEETHLGTMGVPSKLKMRFEYTS